VLVHSVFMFFMTKLLIRLNLTMYLQKQLKVSAATP